MGESGIQHKSVHLAQSGYGHDDAGGLVPIVMPQHEQESEVESAESATARREVIVALLSRLLESGDAETIGRKVLILAYLVPSCAGRPRTLEELGARFNSGGQRGVGKARVSQILSALNVELRTFSGLFAEKRSSD